MSKRYLKPAARRKSKRVSKARLDRLDPFLFRLTAQWRVFANSTTKLAGGMRLLAESAKAMLGTCKSLLF